MKSTISLFGLRLNLLSLLFAATSFFADDSESKDPVAVDLNDSSLDFEANLDKVDMEKDQFASMPVIPDGTYMAKLIHKQQDNAFWHKAKTKKGNKPYLVTQIEARVIDMAGNFDNWPIFDNQVSTLVMENSGTNKIVGILKALKVPTAEIPRDPKALAQKLTDLLAGEPTVKITTQWEGYCETCEKTKVKGMKRYPKKKDDGAKHDPVMECPTDGTEIKTSARILKYLPEDYVEKSRTA